MQVTAGRTLILKSRQPSSILISKRLFGSQSTPPPVTIENVDSKNTNEIARHVVTGQPDLKKQSLSSQHLDEKSAPPVQIQKTPFQAFLLVNLTKSSEKNGGLGMEAEKAALKRLNHQWERMSTEDKQTYREMALSRMDLSRIGSDKSQESTSKTSETTTTTTTTTIGFRPENPYILFTRDFAKRQPKMDGESVEEYSRRVGKAWVTLATDDKQAYYVSDKTEAVANENQQNHLKKEDSSKNYQTPISAASSASNNKHQQPFQTDFSPFSSKYEQLMNDLRAKKQIPTPPDLTIKTAADSLSKNQQSTPPASMRNPVQPTTSANLDRKQQHDRLRGVETKRLDEQQQQKKALTWSQRRRLRRRYRQTALQKFRDSKKHGIENRRNEMNTRPKGPKARVPLKIRQELGTHQPVEGGQGAEIRTVPTGTAQLDAANKTVAQDAFKSAVNPQSVQTDANQITDKDSSSKNHQKAEDQQRQTTRFGLFLADVMPQIKAQYPKLLNHQFRVIANATWSRMSAEYRQKYKKQTAEKLNDFIVPKKLSASKKYVAPRKFLDAIAEEKRNPPQNLSSTSAEKSNPPQNSSSTNAEETAALSSTADSK